ncbi:AGE family epimerase/isomerase [Ancylobacter sp. MQZ15Z-1]|uniref:AGE family epimerase/isomerase n=1 Tax=Ancylobacter mangrovi TaxID=2972472 RepID=A0A9X2PF06_9HYPH|nr:AGE family epimerase/isomerase [Ancylobacter mangrovi]MCS0495706.1 AGE family epimerase/isomerase [Ancylobacter mangrovi]
MNQHSAQFGAPARARPARLSAWLTELFLPRWIERTIVPGRPGYVEEVFRKDGTPVPGEMRGTMLTGRLVHTFCLAHGFDGAPATRRVAEHGLGFLLDACRLAPGRFAHAVDADGGVLDAEADLYDLAFVLLALGSYAAMSGETRLIAIAGEIGARLDGELSDPRGGYREPAGGEGLRRQFPQMHLFEAFLQLADLDPAGGWDLRAERVLDLVGRLTAPEGGTAPGIDEWYEPDWRPLADTRQREREVGHHFEWAWLLYRHAETGGPARAAEIGDAFYRAGLKATGVGAGRLARPVPNRLDGAGRPLPLGRPLWPTGELLRASLEAQALGQDIDRGALAETALDALFEHALDTQTGLWINETDVDGQPVGDTVPARVLYHIVPHLIAYLRALPGG